MSIEGVSCPIPSKKVVDYIRRKFFRNPNEEQNKEEAIRILQDVRRALKFNTMGDRRRNRDLISRALVLLGKEPWEL